MRQASARLRAPSGFFSASSQSKPLCTTPLASTPNANKTTTTISMSGFFFMNYPAFQSIEIII